MPTDPFIRANTGFSVLLAASLLAGLLAATSGRLQAGGPPWDPIDTGAHLNHAGYQSAMDAAQSGSHLQAAAAFRTLADEARGTSVGAWALLQEGICERLANRGREAVSTWDELRRNYPQTHMARLAEERLPGLQRERDMRRTPRVSDPNCGPKALARACEALGRNTNLEELIRRCKPGPDGCTLQQLADAAKSVGLRAEGVKLNPSGLRHERGPGIAWVNRNHYVVVLETAEPLTVYDPNDGTDRQVRLADFQKRWDGYLLLLRRQ